MGAEAVKGIQVSMPWRNRVKGIVQAWYGVQAIAEILTGTVNPSGRLPLTFPETLAQTPRPEVPGPRYALGDAHHDPL
jgi:beta-glucosidase